jgi:hypothetical protein
VVNPARAASSGQRHTDNFELAVAIRIGESTG